MEVFGLPAHALVVHAAVVLVPLAALGGLAISLLTSMRRRYGSLVVVGAFGALASTVAAQVTGSSYAATLEQIPPATQAHMVLGDDLLVWAILLAVGTAVQMAGQWMIDRDHPRGPLLRTGGIVLTAVCAVVATVQVVRIGHAGSYAVWG